MARPWLNIGDCGIVNGFVCETLPSGISFTGAGYSTQFFHARRLDAVLSDIWLLNARLNGLVC